MRLRFIPKADGRQRPLGIAAVEDKIVQQAVVTILNQIYEVDSRSLFHHCLLQYHGIGVLGISDIDESLTTEQAKELIRLCRTGRLHDIQKWIADGRSLQILSVTKKTLLQIAVEVGFHSIVELIAMHESSQSSKNAALANAVSMRRLDLVQLLFAKGADIKSVPLADVLLCWEPRIIRFFLDHGAEAVTGSPFAIAFGARVRTALRPFIEYRQGHPGIATELNGQLDCALRHFCGEADLKWISLLLWAGADPRTLGPTLDERYNNDPECDTTGLREACYAGNVAALKKLKVDPDRDDLSDLLQCAAISACLDTLRYLLELGANANDKANGGSSALDTSLWHLHFGSFEVLRSKRLRSRYDVHKALECVEGLVAHGAIWRPDRAEINSLRRALCGCEPSVMIDLMKLFLGHNAYPRGAVQELLRTPRMKQHLSTETRNLSRLGLSLEDRQNRKRQPPPPALLARYNRAELYEKLWTEPTRIVAKHFGVSDVWLSKVCKALRVPRPGRGYWAKKRAGRSVAKRPPLPSLG